MTGRGLLCVFLAAARLLAPERSFAVTAGEPPVVRAWVMFTAVPSCSPPADSQEAVTELLDAYGDILDHRQAELFDKGQLTPLGSSVLAEVPFLHYVKRALDEPDVGPSRLRVRFREWRDKDRFGPELEASFKSEAPVHLVELGTSMADELSRGALPTIVPFEDRGARLPDSDWARRLMGVGDTNRVLGIPRQLDVRLLWYWPADFPERGRAIREAGDLDDLGTALAAGRAFGVVRRDNAFPTLTALAAAAGAREAAAWSASRLSLQFKEPFGFLRTLAVAARLRLADDEVALQEAFHTRAISAMVSGPWTLLRVPDGGEVPESRFLPSPGGLPIVDGTKGTVLCQTRMADSPATLCRMASLLASAPGPAWPAVGAAATPSSTLQALGRRYLGRSAPDDPGIELRFDTFTNDEASRTALEYGRYADRLAEALDQLKDPSLAARFDPGMVFRPTRLERFQPWGCGALLAMVVTGCLLAARNVRRRRRARVVTATCCLLSKEGIHAGLGTFVLLDRQIVLVTCRHVVEEVGGETIKPGEFAMSVRSWASEAFEKCGARAFSVKLLPMGNDDVAFLGVVGDEDVEAVQLNRRRLRGWSLLAKYDVASTDTNTSDVASTDTITSQEGHSLVTGWVFNEPKGNALEQRQVLKLPEPAILPTCGTSGGGVFTVRGHLGGVVTSIRGNGMLHFIPASTVLKAWNTPLTSGTEPPRVTGAGRRIEL